MSENYNDIFANRGSVRLYAADRTISDETLNGILEAAMHAPTTGNMQLYSVIVTREPERRARLAELHMGQPAACAAHVMLTFCADVRRFDRWCDARDADRSMDNFGGYLMAIVDATIYAQQVNTLAELNGLGCVYLGTVTYNLDGFCEALDIPDGVVPLFTIAMGYPVAGEEIRPSLRLPLSAIVHNERYRDCDIDAAYAETEAQPDAGRFITENDLQTLAQVFSQVRYPRSLNEQVGRSVLSYVNPD